MDRMWGKSDPHRPPQDPLRPHVGNYVLGVDIVDEAVEDAGLQVIHRLHLEFGYAHDVVESPYLLECNRR